jgi:hypothetical protein
MFCLKNSGGISAVPVSRLRTGALQAEEREEDREDAVVVVDGVGVDAGDTQEDEREGEEGGERGCPTRTQIPFGNDKKNGRKDAPGEQRGRGSGEHGIGDDVPVHAAEEVDAGGLDQEGEWSVREREVAVGNLAQRDAVAAVEQVREVPQHGDMGVLPEDDGRGGQQEERAGDHRQACRERAGWRHVHAVQCMRCLAERFIWGVV